MSRNPFVNGPGSAAPDPNKRMGFVPTNKEIVATRGVKLKTELGYSPLGLTERWLAFSESMAGVLEPLLG